MNRSELQCPGYPTNYECEVLLAGGATVRVRPIRLDDAAGLREFHDHLSAESVHRRFFGAHPHLRPQEVERFTCVDYQDRLALVVETDAGLAAVARYDRLPGTDSAEVAFVVADALHGQGVGTLLLEHLAVAGRRAGIATFFAETLAYNHPMVQMFNRSGFACTSRTSQGVIDLSFPISPTQRYLDHLTDRHFHAVRAWLAPPGAVLTAPGAVLAPDAQVGVLRDGSPRPSTVAAICRHDGIAISRVVGSVPSGTNQTDLLASFSLDPSTQVVVLELADVAQPRRFVVTARRLSERTPVVALLGSDAARPSGLVDLCAQAGVEILDRNAGISGRLRELLTDVVAGTWRPISRGTLPEVDGYDVAQAQAVLGAPRNGRTATGSVAGPPQKLLGPLPTQALLAAYGVAAGVARTPEVPLGLTVTVGHDDRHGGLAVRVTSPSMPAGGPISRVLPLTERDAHELVCAAAPDCRDQAPLVDRVVRASHLVDDRAEVAGLNLPLVADARGEAFIWLGPPRSTDDDPFCSKLVNCPASPR